MWSTSKRGVRSCGFCALILADFNPIEEAFSKVKALLKKAAARTREALLEAIAEALSVVTSEDV